MVFSLGRSSPYTHIFSHCKDPGSNPLSQSNQVVATECRSRIVFCIQVKGVVMNFQLLKISASLVAPFSCVRL